MAEGSNRPMDEKAQARTAQRRRRRRVLIVVKIFVFAMILANMGLLAWYVSKHPIKLRAGGRARVLTVRPAELDFGRAEAGKPLTQKVTIRNCTRDEVEIQFVEFTNGSFRLKETLHNLALARRGEVELTVIYEPDVGGVSTGEMRVRLRGRSSPELVVPLRGEAPLPRLVLSAGSLEFGEVKTRAGARLPLKLLNKGTQALKVTGIAVRGQGFGLARPFTHGTIKPNASLTIEVVFVPTKTGASEGALLITSNDPNEQEMTVGLSGSFGAAAKRQREKARALALLDEAKRDLNTAYTYLSERSTNKLLMRERHRMGREAFEKAWPKYESANSILRSINPALEDKEYYVDNSGALKRRSPGGN